MTTTSIAAGDQSFATGLLYASAQVILEQHPVLLISYDLPYPKPLAECCPIIAPFASALLLSHEVNDTSIAQLTLNLDAGPDTTMDEPSLESLRSGNPAARGLPLLANIARGGGQCHLPYLGEQRLHVVITPCC